MGDIPCACCILIIIIIICCIAAASIPAAGAGGEAAGISENGSREAGDPGTGAAPPSSPSASDSSPPAAARGLPVVIAPSVPASSASLILSSSFEIDFSVLVRFCSMLLIVARCLVSLSFRSISTARVRFSALRIFCSHALTCDDTAASPSFCASAEDLTVPSSVLSSDEIRDVSSSTFLAISPAACSRDVDSCLTTSSRSSSRIFSKSDLTPSIFLLTCSDTKSVRSTTEALAAATPFSTLVHPLLKSSICLCIDSTVFVKYVLTSFASVPILDMRFSCVSPRSW